MTNHDLLLLAAKGADDKRAEQIVALNMQGISLIADYFLICQGNSEKQIQAIAKEIKDLVEEQDYTVKRLEGYDEARWVLIDIGDVVVHIFHKDERSYYNLEKLWGDAQRVDLQQELSQ
ncbi:MULTISPECIES: ribosome silencing factor [Bacillaceae]|uniref:ribosome silencing factor n=1 Tax=Bacillaceae TaxID=186817 RepID=UPI001BDEE4C1|nr:MULTISPECIES: ribosome silencing factor [Bacillaceae]MDX8359518.1 ribosome silencing factor [Cytobacillus sp. IB215316]MDX8364160.1 ribosome silencing factor [Cytobacillus sp. IB215665]